MEANDPIIQQGKISLATYEAAITNNLPKLLSSMKKLKKNQVTVDFEFPHVDNFLNRERLAVVVMRERVFFGLFTRRKQFFVHVEDGLPFLSRTETKTSFYGVFAAAEAADKAVTLYVSSHPEKQFILNI